MSSESSTLLPRALADTYPFDPYFKANVRHPALKDFSFMLPLWGNWSDPDVSRTILGQVRRLAEEKTAKKRVRHLEVVVDRGQKMVGIYFITITHDGGPEEEDGDDVA